MNLRDLLEEFFIERGYHKTKEHTWGSTTHWDIAFSKGLDGGDNSAVGDRFDVWSNGSEYAINIRGDIDNPSEIVVTAYEDWVWNSIWVEKINISDPNSLNCLDKALRVGKTAVIE